MKKCGEGWTKGAVSEILAQRSGAGYAILGFGKSTDLRH